MPIGCVPFNTCYVVYYSHILLLVYAVFCHFICRKRSLMQGICQLYQIGCIPLDTWLVACFLKVGMANALVFSISAKTCFLLIFLTIYYLLHYQGNGTPTLFFCR